MRLKFQTRLTVVYLALFLIVQGIIIGAFYSSITQNVKAQIEEELNASSRIFERIIDVRTQYLTARATDLSSDFGFRQAVATADEPTVQSALENLTGRIQVDLAYIYGIDDKVIASTKSSSIVQPVIPRVLKSRAEDEGAATTIIRIDTKIYELVVVPVRAPITVAWIVLAIEVNKAVAEDIKALTARDIEIAFFYEQKGQYMLASASVESNAVRRMVNEQLGTTGSRVFQTNFNDEEFIFRRLHLVDASTGDEKIDALVYFSVNKALQPYRELAVTLSCILFAGLLFLIGGSLVISRSITRPLRQLALAARRIATGEYHEVRAPANDEEILHLTSSFNQMNSAIKEREESILFHSHHDVETGLSNRYSFEQSVTKIIESSNQFTIAIAEVQQLAELRSVLNHEHINQLLKEISQRIKQSINSSVARLSTDTFGFILDNNDQVELNLNTISNCFLTPFYISGIAIDANIKIGLACYPKDGMNPSRLMQCTNSALDASRATLTGVAWYVPDCDEAFKNRLSLMSDFRAALDNGEITFAYQPKLDLATNQIGSVEALVRWNSPTRGFVPPDDFIPFAERTGDIQHLTEWGLNAALSQCAQWRAKGIHLVVAINLAASDLLNRSLPDQITTLLKRYDLTASNLKLEVTESAVMQDMQRALEVLNILSQMGHELSIDDYGTGYSSLSYLKKLPVNELKIDKSFILNLASNDEDRILVRSTIELGHNLGLKITAEGVEDSASLEILRDFGCDTLQGYFISKPVPASEIEHFLSAPVYYEA